MRQWEGEISQNSIFMKQHGSPNTKNRIAVQVSRLKLHFHSHFKNFEISLVDPQCFPHALLM